MILLHRIVNAILEDATDRGSTVIAVEELTGIRTRLPGPPWCQNWDFERLSESVEYKAELRGIDGV